MFTPLVFIEKGKIMEGKPGTQDKKMTIESFMVCMRGKGRSGNGVRGILALGLHKLYNLDTFEFERSIAYLKFIHHS